VYVGGIMEHIEQAGVHSGDSSCSLPPVSLSADLLAAIEDQVSRMALELGVVGLMNTQFAIQGEEVFIIEVNPRASRTVPFVSKAIGLPLAKVAARCMAGRALDQQGVGAPRSPSYYSVKGPVFPFNKFPGVDPILGPEMRSTGEVMGVGETFGEAYAKAQLASSVELPREGGLAFISVRDSDKHLIAELADELKALGFGLVATHGTARYLREAGVECEGVNERVWSVVVVRPDPGPDGAGRPHADADHAPDAPDPSRERAAPGHAGADDLRERACPPAARGRHPARGGRIALGRRRGVG